jgi:gliding motility-associated lipoprotein GldH
VIKNNFYTIFLSCLVTALAACTKSNLYDKNISIHEGQWAYGDAKKFKVNIIDTASNYNLFVNVRHTDQYQFNNLWLIITTTYPDSSTRQDKVNVELSQTDGRWTGTCVDGICYNSVLVQTDFTFPQKGDYIFAIEQDMRMNPITEIFDIGLKIEKF